MRRVLGVFERLTSDRVLDSLTCKPVEESWKIAELSMRPMFRAEEE